MGRSRWNISTHYEEGRAIRVNVYAEELTDRVELVTKRVDEDGINETFYGVRVYLGFPFIHREGDDDSSAVTFWVPWTKADGHDFDKLRNILLDMALVLFNTSKGLGALDGTKVKEPSKMSGEYEADIVSARERLDAYKGQGTDTDPGSEE